MILLSKTARRVFHALSRYVYATSAGCFAVIIAAAFNTPLFGAFFPLVLQVLPPRNHIEPPQRVHAHVTIRPGARRLVLQANMPVGNLSAQLIALLLAVYFQCASDGVKLTTRSTAFFGERVVTHQG